jgi:3-methyladenine DNA glycosylase/8-oxoguanine DNA glycosylase
VAETLSSARPRTGLFAGQRNSPDARYARQVRAAERHLRRADPVMAELVRGIGPCTNRLQRGGTVFTALAESIQYQQVTGRVAAVLWRRLCKRTGRRHPRPVDILSLSDAELRACGQSRQKASYLTDLASHAVTGRLPRRFDHLSDEEVIAALTHVKGVGRWTVEMLLIFRLGRLDVLPVNDYGIQKAMQKAYRMRTLPKPDRMRRVAEPWRPYRSIACWYLWRSIDGAAGRAKA